MARPLTFRLIFPRGLKYNSKLPFKSIEPLKPRILRGFVFILNTPCFKIKRAYSKYRRDEAVIHYQINRKELGIVFVIIFTKCKQTLNLKGGFYVTLNTL